MASKSSIGAIIKLDGESTFKASVANCKQQIKTLNSELKSIQSAYSGNLNGLEALTKQYDVYAKKQSTIQKEIQTLNTALSQSENVEKIAKEKMQELAKAYDDAEAKLKELKNSENTNADAIEEQSKVVEKARKEYIDQSTAVEKAEKQTSYYVQQITDLSTQEQQATAQMKKFNAYIEEAKESADGAAKSIDEMGAAISDSGNNADTTSASSNASAVTAGITAGFTSAGVGLATKALGAVKDAAVDATKAMISVGSSFEASMSNVEALSGAAGTDLENLTEKAAQLGRDTQYTASEAADALGYMALAGWDTEQMLASIDGVLNLAAASSMDLATASDIVTDYISAFGLAASDSGHFVDVMATAMSSSNTDTEQLGEAYKNCAAIAGQFGYSVEETTAALMVMANAGVKGGEAGTSLGTIMTRLATDTKNCATELSGYGVEIYDANGNMNSFSSIMEGIAGVFDTLTEKEQANLAKIIAGQSQYSEFLTLLSGMSDEVKEAGKGFADYTDLLENCDDAAANMAETVNDNLSGDMKEFSSALEGLGINIYDYFVDFARPAIEGVTDVINDLADAIKKEDSDLETFIDSVKDKNKELQDSIKENEANYSADSAELKTMQTYMDIIEELQGKQELTAYETYQLNTAVEYLSDSVPELSQYIGDVNSLLSATPDEMTAVVNAFDSAYAKIRATSVLEYRNNLLKELADAETQKTLAYSALDESLTEYGAGLTAERLVEGKNLSIAEIIAAEDYTMADWFSHADEMLAADSAHRSVIQLTNDLEEYDAAMQSEYETLGLVIDENGDLVSTTEDVTEATDESSESMDAAAESATVLQTNTEKATTALEALADIDISTNLKTQLSDAAEEFTDFKDTIISGLESFDALTNQKNTIMEALYGTSDENADLSVTGYRNTFDEMQNAISSNLSAMEMYTDDINTLTEAGASDAMIQYFASMGDSGMQYTHALAEIAKENEAAFQQYQQQFEQYESYQAGTNENVQALLNTYADSIMNGVEDGYNAWYEFGIQTTQGLIDSISAAQALIEGGDYSDLSLAYANILHSKYDEKNGNAAAANTQTRTTLANNSNGGTWSDISKNLAQNITVDLTVDGETLASVVTKSNRAKTKRTG